MPRRTTRFLITMVRAYRCRLIGLRTERRRRPRGYDSLLVGGIGDPCMLPFLAVLFLVCRLFFLMRLGLMLRYLISMLMTHGRVPEYILFCARYRQRGVLPVTERSGLCSISASLNVHLRLKMPKLVGAVVHGNYRPHSPFQRIRSRIDSVPCQTTAWRLELLAALV